MSHRNGIPLAFLAASMASCHLLVGQPSCDDLEGANRAEYELRQCEPFVCSAEGLLARVRGERFDGHDNDCDGRVDEGVWKWSVERRLLTSLHERPSAQVTWSSVERSTMGSSLRVFLSDRGESGLSCNVQLVDGDVTPCIGLELRPMIQPLPPGTNELPIPAPCPVCLNGEVRVGRCQMSGLQGVQQADEADRGWLFAALDDTPGQRGRLRLGGARSDQQSFVQQVDSPHFAGVDVDCGGRTDWARARSVSRVSIAASTTSGSALVAWVASAVDEPGMNACVQQEEAAVRVLPLTTDQGTPSPIDGPGDLGNTTGTAGRPAIVPVETVDGGLGWFLVAFGQRDGVSLCLVPEGRSRCVGSRLHIDDLDVDQVALARGGGDGSPSIGVTWTRGCGAEVKFARVLVHRDGGAASLEHAPSSVLRLARGHNLTSPSVVWSGSPFRAPPSVARTQDAGASDEASGARSGWIVSWVDAAGRDQAVFGTRVDADGVRDEARGGEEPTTMLHVPDGSVLYHALHRLPRGDTAVVVSFVATTNGIRLRELY